MKKTIFFIFLIMFAFLAAGNAKADENELNDDDSTKTVKIGYYREDKNFQDGFFDTIRKSGYAYDYLQELAIIAKWKYKYIYGSRAEIISKMLAGEIDITAGIYKSDKSLAQFFLSDIDMGLDGVPRYFAVNKERPDLINELNKAQKKLLDLYPNLTIMLRQKYYGRFSQQTLTPAEKQWLTNLGSLKIGYVKNNLPLSDVDKDGKPIGVVKEVFELIESFIQIKIEPVCYENVALMEEGLKRNEIHAAFPIYSDLWITETKGFYQTDAFISDRVMIIYKGSYRSGLMDRIALSETGVGQRYYLSIFYPKSKTVFFPTREEAIEALQSGKADSMIGCSGILQRFLVTHKEYSNFNIAYLDTSENFGIAANRGASTLITILNKAIRQIDAAAITGAMVKYSNTESIYSLTDVIHDYAVGIISLLSVFIGLIMWMYARYRHQTKLFKEQQIKSRAVLEDALTAANAANKAKTSFLSSMSHDIRTPMNGIIGMTAIAEANLDNPTRVEDCLKKITSSGKHLLGLINEVLDMAKIESGEISLNDEIFNLPKLIDDLIILNKSLIDAKQQDLKVHVMNIPHEEVVGDSLRIQQVFTNILSNAIKYTPEGGRVDVTLSEKTGRTPNVACYEFTVEDNGIGMSKEYLPYIFDPFTRADNSSKNKTQGTGLGMAIANNIVRMMDGNIYVESELGKGTKFTVTIYLKIHENNNISYRNFEGLNILVVDDDEVICESISLLLKDMGMNCEWVMSGKEAIKKVEECKDGNHYFAILIDWKMPEMNGVETTTHIRRCIGGHVPIIIISAFDWSSIEDEALKAGANGCIGKPLFKSRLLHLFDKLTGTYEAEKETGLNEIAKNITFKGKRTLLAEDNEINAEIAIEVLNMFGMEVDWAVNGKEAVDKLEKSKPNMYDCILMDVQMPVMDGLEATKIIRKMKRKDIKDIPIFAMTANAFADDVQAALKSGMNEHIAKPIDFNILAGLLNKYLQ